MSSIDYERSFRVPLSDIDLNEHVNNTKYLKWLIDSFERKDWNTPWTSIEANYLAEARFAEHIVVKRQVEGSIHRMEAHSDDLNKPVFRAEIRFRK